MAFKKLPSIDATNDSTSYSAIYADHLQNTFKRCAITGSDLFNFLPYPAVFFDGQDNIFEYNTAFQNRFHPDLTNNTASIHSFLNQIFIASHPYNEDFKIVYQGTTYWSHLAEVVHNGQNVGSLLFLRDMSRFEKTFAELAHVKSINERLDSVINASFDGLYITDGHGVTLRLNKAFERITGVTASVCLGKNMR